MMNFYIISIMIMISFVLLSYVMNRSHVLMMLISLEFISLMLFLFMYIEKSLIYMDQYILMYYLTFCVCEGVLGLSMLVGMIRSHGNDFLGSLNFLKC